MTLFVLGQRGGSHHANPNKVNADDDIRPEVRATCDSRGITLGMAFARRSAY